jgi:hypothetical protein
MIGKYLSAIAVVVFLILLSALGFQTYRVEGLQGDLELARLNSDRFLQTANQNVAVLERIKNDYNGSLNACYQDYKTLSDGFDNYRKVVAASKNIVSTDRPIAIAGVSKTASCEIIEGDAIANALNGFNDGR